MTAVFSRGSSRRYVLDANALIGFFEARRGSAEKVRHLLGEAARQDLPLLMSAVNWGEVFYTEWRARGEAKALEAEGALLEMRRHCCGSRARFAGRGPKAETWAGLRRCIRRRTGY